MKLVTFSNNDGDTRIGWIAGNGVVDMQLADPRLPGDMLTFIDRHELYFKIITDLGDVGPHYPISDFGYQILDSGLQPCATRQSKCRILPPLPNPRSIRDYIGFEMHMLNASRSFGHKVGEVWYEMPIFYFTNHQMVFGPDDKIKRPEKEIKLDLETEMACIIGKQGANIKKENARDYIFGYTVFNDWTARAIQKREMSGPPLGPHKGKDFANAFGPCIVTADEMEQYRCAFSESDFPSPLKVPAIKGDRLDVEMKARINGKTICQGNYQTVYFNFEQQIERASENGVCLMPGDILGSGTVGWGSLIENNFEVHRPLEPGDVVELEIEGIGVLRNSVV